MYWEQLGGVEVTKEKGIFFAFSIFVLLFLYYASIGASPHLLKVLHFYIGFTIFGLFFIFFDMMTKQKELEYVDTVTIETTSPLSPKMQLMLGLALSALLGWWIGATGQALVGANPFGAVFNVFESPVGNAVISAVVGGFCESIVFFSVVYPSVHRILWKFLDSPLATLLAILIGSGIFFVYHNFVYRYNEVALQSVFIFGLINCILVLLTRSIIPGIMIHATNNFLVVLFNITKFGIFVVL